MGVFEQPVPYRWDSEGCDNTLILDPHPDDKYQEVPHVVTAVPPVGWRAAWAVLRGRFQPRLRVTRRMNLRMTDDALREVYVGPIKDQLNRKRP